ncbi:hypothetical protein Tco_0822262 [Tanacetum coccineum]|uniref:Reverse transcriptase Ty1/copia-type domain-containing protein n=1 Tax=Tanacetum coccineum TaxID=301880 RepID=A0ABQ5AIT9_9ASTR
MVICLYVDDILIIGTTLDGILETKSYLSSNFKMKDLGEECNTPFDISVNLKPEIAFAVSKLSQYTSNPSLEHWDAVSRVLGYLKRTSALQLTYTSYPGVLEGFSDASWINHSGDSKSTKDVVVISSDKVEGSGDWNSPQFQDTANSRQKKETKAMVFYQMDTEEVSNRFVAPCFVNGLEAYDGEINLGVEENMISHKYAVKLCLEHEVKRGNEVVKKELIVALRGEIYFVKFIINPEEDDIKPGVIFGRSFLCLTKAITDFGAKTVIIYPDIDPFLEKTKEWDHLLNFNIDDVPLLGEEGLPLFVCKMGKNSRNKKRATENLNFFYQDIGTSSSAGGHLT